MRQLTRDGLKCRVDPGCESGLTRHAGLINEHDLKLIGFSIKGRVAYNSAFQLNPGQPASYNHPLILLNSEAANGGVLQIICSTASAES